MNRRPFTDLCLALAAALGCASTPPPAPTVTPATTVAPPQQSSGGAAPAQAYLVLVPVPVAVRPPEPPATDLDAAVEDYVDWSREFQRRIGAVLAHDTRSMPARCTRRCTPHGCTCD